MLRNVAVTRDFDRTLPSLCAHGGELNQVWTNLIDNAIYAAGGTGRIDIRTRRDGEFFLVERPDRTSLRYPSSQPRVAQARDSAWLSATGSYDPVLPLSPGRPEHGFEYPARHFSLYAALEVSSRLGPQSSGVPPPEAERSGIVIQFDPGFSEELPYSDASFDRVLSAFMLHPFMLHHVRLDAKRSLFRRGPSCFEASGLITPS
jgi:hypothetical protein